MNIVIFTLLMMPLVIPLLTVNIIFTIVIDRYIIKPLKNNNEDSIFYNNFKKTTIRYGAAISIFGIIISVISGLQNPKFLAAIPIIELISITLFYGVVLPMFSISTMIRIMRKTK